MITYKIVDLKKPFVTNLNFRAIDCFYSFCDVKMLEEYINVVLESYNMTAKISKNFINKKANIYAWSNNAKNSKKTIIGAVKKVYKKMQCKSFKKPFTNSLEFGIITS